MGVPDDLMYEILNYLGDTDVFNISKFFTIKDYYYKYLLQKHYNITIPVNIREKLILYDRILEELNNIIGFNVTCRGINIYDFDIVVIQQVIDKYSDYISLIKIKIVYGHGYRLVFNDIYSWSMYMKYYTGPDNVVRNRYNLYSISKKINKIPEYSDKQVFMKLNSYYNSIKLIFDTMKQYNIDVTTLPTNKYTELDNCNEISIMLGNTNNINSILDLFRYIDNDIVLQYVPDRTPDIYAKLDRLDISFKNKFFSILFGNIFKLNSYEYTNTDETLYYLTIYKRV